VSCTLGDTPLASEGNGTSRRAAEQAAAEDMLAHLPSASH
jgi:dsRNA-specific ribonuclease